MTRLTPWAALAAALLCALPAFAAPVQESRAVAGLAAPAEIKVDRWGIPHIYAASVRDAFFLQGYNAARDRLWQIDLWRKRGLGLLAKDFGPAYSEQDRASRLLMDYVDAAGGPEACDPKIMDIHFKAIANLLELQPEDHQEGAKLVSHLSAVVKHKGKAKKAA